MSIRTKLFDKGKLVEEQMVRFLIKIDERITALEKGDGSSVTQYDDTEIKADITALENRIKALEDA